MGEFSQFRSPVREERWTNRLCLSFDGANRLGEGGVGIAQRGPSYLPAGWNSELRLFADFGLHPDSGDQSRVLQGLITRIGFVGGGAILKEGATVRGTATAASICNAGIIGGSMAR